MFENIIALDTQSAALTYALGADIALLAQTLHRGRHAHLQPPAQ